MAGTRRGAGPIGLWLALLLVLASCGPGAQAGDDAVGDTGIGAEATEGGPTDDDGARPGSILRSWDHPDPSDLARPPALPSGTLTINGCRWSGPGRWEADLHWESDPAPSSDEPLEVFLGIAYAIQAPLPGEEVDETAEGPRYGVELGLATLTGNGSFTVAMTGAQGVYGFEADGWWRLQPAAEWPPTGRCDAIAIGSDTEDEPSYENGVDVARTPVPLPEVAGDRPDTVEALAATVPLDEGWAESPMAALALLAGRDDVPVDHLYLDPDQPVAAIEITHLAPCVVVTVAQADGGVRQTRGCSPELIPDLDPERAVTIPDETWEVVADGDAAYVAALQSITFLGGIDPAEAPSLDPDMAAALGFGPEATPGRAVEDEATGGDDDWAVLGRYPWQDTEVEVSFDQAQDRCCVIYEAEAAGFNGGDTGRACRDWMIAVHDDGTRGFIVVVVHGDRNATISVDGEPLDIALEPTGHDGLRAAVIDAPFDVSAPADHLARIHVLEPDGSPSPCIQT